MRDIERLRRKLGPRLDGAGVILTPEQAKAQMNIEFNTELSTLWQLREQATFAFLSGGGDPTAAAGVAHEVGKALTRARVEEIAAASQITGAPLGEGFRFLAAMVDAELPAEKPGENPDGLQLVKPH